MISSVQISHFPSHINGTAFNKEIYSSCSYILYHDLQRYISIFNINISTINHLMYYFKTLIVWNFKKLSLFCCYLHFTIFYILAEFQLDCIFFIMLVVLWKLKMDFEDKIIYTKLFYYLFVGISFYDLFDFKQQIFGSLQKRKFKFNLMSAGI